MARDCQGIVVMPEPRWTIWAGHFPESASFGNWKMRVRIPSGAPLFGFRRTRPQCRVRPEAGGTRPNVSATGAGKEVKMMAEPVHAELLESLSPTVESLAEASTPLVPGIPGIPGIPEAVSAPVATAVPVPEDDIPLATPLSPASEPVAESLPEVSAVFAELPAAPIEPG
jgi:hypothetical protein